MLSRLKKLFLAIVADGIKFPHAYDPVDKQASFRLLCAYLSFMLAFGSVLALHFFAVLEASITAISFYALCMVFYMLKKLTSAKIDLDDKEISLSSNEKVDKSESD